MTHPLYSICMCNYNMARTLEQSLTSIAGQLDDRFEIVVVDDGSRDTSIQVIKKMATKFPIIRLISLSRDPKRQLGLTRNHSIEQARGTYVLLHLDCDDVYGPYIKDFVEAFDQIERVIPHPFLLSGQHIQMARRDFLLSHGPYRNIHRGEDRDLWSRLSVENAYIPFDHINFVTRLPKTFNERFSRAIRYTWNHLENDFRAGLSLKTFLGYEMGRLKNPGTFTYRMIIYRMLIATPVFICAKFKEPIAKIENEKNSDERAVYRAHMRGNLETLVKRYGGNIDWSPFSTESKKIFDVKAAS